MEQQQFKVSFSLGTKLLLSVLLLLTMVVAFLNISAILLLREDKRAYTYQSQSTEAVLAGREFVTNLRHQLDTLRIALGQLDPLRPLGAQQAAALQSMVDNQSDLIAVGVGLIDLHSGMFRQVAGAARANAMKDEGLTAGDLAVPPERVLPALPQLVREGYAFVNLSRVNGASAIGVLVADTRLAGNVSGMPIAIGVASLTHFGAELSGMNLTIATRSGWVLFDTDPSALYGNRNLKDDPLFQTAATSRLSSGAREYDAEGRHYIASFTQPGFDILVFSRTDWKKAIRATYDLIIKFALLGLMAVGAALVFAIVFSKTLTRPINTLYKATQEVARGNFNLDIQIRSRDEIGALTGSFNQMSHQISDLIRSQADKIHLENEMAIASTVQQTLIPPPEFRNSDVYIHSHYQAASQCGGDWWGFFGVGKKLGVMIADATGHGMPSALITASARSCFSIMHKLAQEDADFSFSPSAMLSYANRVVFDASLGKIMMTFFVGVLDFESMTLTYSGAGHNPPWLFEKQQDGSFALKSLTAVGQRLGEARDVPDFEEQTVRIAPGDMLFMYTDGLTEGKNADGDMFGKKRVRKLVQSSLASGPRGVVEELMRDFLRYNGEKPLDDDVTLATLLILDKAGSSA